MIMELGTEVSFTAKMVRRIFPKTRAELGAFQICRFEYEASRQDAPIPLRKGEVVSVKGNLLPTDPAQSGRMFEVRGVLKKDATWGWTVEAARSKEIIPKTEEGIVAYLSSGMIKGIGKATAKKIYAAYGEKTLDVLKTDPDRLLELKGISASRVESIKESLLLLDEDMSELVALLLPEGVSIRRCCQIYEKYKEQSLYKVRTEPHELCKEIYGIGFYTADKIALAAGADMNTVTRAEAAMLHVLREAEIGGDLFRNSGHMCVAYDELVGKTVELLQKNLDVPYPKQLISRAGSNLMREGKIHKEGKYFFRQDAYTAENGVAIAISDLMKTKVKAISSLDAIITAVEAENGVIMDTVQKTAVKTALRSPVTVITGGPGTGKTTILNVLLHTFRRVYPTRTFCLMAPTGKAARRMSIATHEEAATIHRALGLTPEDVETVRFPDGMLDADLVIVDETSMIDQYLAYNLFSRIRSTAQVVLVGDIDQLPSVGPGAVLREIIDCGKIPTVRLTTVYRQEGMSSIAINAARIRSGNGSSKHLEYDDSFRMVRTECEDDAAELATDAYALAVQKHGIENVILLSPLRKRGATGVISLNAMLQERINPSIPGKSEFSKSHAAGETVFREGDPVMVMKNSAAFDVSNGEVGIVREILKDDDDIDVIRVRFDEKEVDFPAREAPIELSYATTVHKSQGSEYPVVIMVLMKSHYIMLKRKLVYTAISRARDHLILVGQEAAYNIAVHGEESAESRRNTFLGRRIAERIGT